MIATGSTKIWIHNKLDVQRAVAEVVGQRVSIGRGVQNDIVLDSYLVAEEAALLERGDGWQLEVLGRNGCKLDGRTLPAGSRVRLDEQSQIEIFPFQLTFEHAAVDQPTGNQRHRRWDDRMSELLHAIHVHLLSLMDVDAKDDARNASVEYLLSLDRNIEEIARLNGVTEAENTELVTHIAGCCVRHGLIERRIEQSGKGSWALHAAGHWSRMVSAVPDREQDLAVVVGRIESRLGLDRLSDLSEQMSRVESDFWPAWDAICGDLFAELRLYLALRELKKQIKDVVFGYGPLEDLLRMPTITEIMVVGADRIYIEKNGLIENSGRRFFSEEVTLAVIERIVSKIGRRIDRSQPLVDARLTDGSRVNAVIAPLAISGPALTIRKFPPERMTMDDLVALGTLTPTVANFLRAAVVAKRNILIAGGTGTGKTTLLNCLSDFIPPKERIVTIEDTAELQIRHDHVVRMETKPKNVEGAGAYSIRDLVKNALRMRPDRIIVGECRGEEALDMLQAMNTGHDGSLTTIHANSPADVQLRLEVMVRSAAELPLDAIHRQIASALDLVVQLTRLRDGSRRVSHVTEIAGVDDELGGLRTKDLFVLEGGAQPALAPTGRLPAFIDKLLDADLVRLESFYR